METKIKGKNVLVTGGAGFIGSHLVDRLVKLKANVTVVDNLERGVFDNLTEAYKECERQKPELYLYDNDRLDVYENDLRIKEECEEVFKDKKPDLVFHLAFKVGGVSYSGNPKFFGEVWRDGTKINMNVIESCLEYKIEKLLFISSACVYPPFKYASKMYQILEKESFPAYPGNAYGWSKLMGELQLKWYYHNYGLKSVIIRPFNIYGERESLGYKLSHVIPALCRKAIEYPKNPFSIHGNGSNTRCFTYVKDLVKAMIIAMKCIDEPIPINIGSPEAITIKDLANKIIEISGKKIKLKYLENYPITGALHRTPDIDRAKKLLKWEPKTTLEDGLEKTYKWIEKELVS